MVANLTVSPNLKTMKHEITSEDVCNFIRHKWKDVESLNALSVEIGVPQSNLYNIIHKDATINLTLPTINKIAKGMRMTTIRFLTAVSRFASEKK